MSTLLEEPAARTTTAPAERLRTTMAAVRVSIKWFGTRKTLTPEQKSQAADTFGAEGDFLSAGKKLIDTAHPAFRAVTAVRHKIVSLWRAVSLPYPESGIRLIRQDRIDEFNARMQELCRELEEAVWRLDEHYAELKSAARERLGQALQRRRLPGIAARPICRKLGFSLGRAAGLSAATQSATVPARVPPRAGAF